MLLHMSTTLGKAVQVDIRLTLGLKRLVVNQLNSTSLSKFWFQTSTTPSVLKAIGFNLFESKALSTFCFQLSTCTPTARLRRRCAQTAPSPRCAWTSVGRRRLTLG